jgi:putative protease
MPKAKKSVKKTVKKVAKKTAEGKLIGKITHYYSNIEVAVIELSAPLKMGDTIRVVGGQETDFEQEVSSMQIDHKEVKSAKKGDSIGMKVKEKVHEGYKVYKI